MILVDANILLRIANREDAAYRQTLSAVFELRTKATLAITSQSLYEFWAVATRAQAHNGLDLSREKAARWISAFRRLFRFLPDPPTLLDAWARLVFDHDIKGFRAHDARYVAVMRLLQIEKLLTYNVQHFQPFGITLLTPPAISKG